MKVIGLTGGIATGKSLAASLLRERFGVKVIDADQAAREVAAPGGPVFDAIVGYFGKSVLDARGQIDRSALRQRISNSVEDRRALEAITHPAIRLRIAECLEACRRSGDAVVVVEAALMVETGSYLGYDALWVVTCEPTTQWSRLLARDGRSEAESRALVSAQLPLIEKERVADHVIRNDLDEEALWVELQRAWHASDLPPEGFTPASNCGAYRGNPSA